MLARQCGRRLLLFRPAEMAHRYRYRCRCGRIRRAATTTSCTTRPQQHQQHRSPPPATPEQVVDDDDNDDLLLLPSSCSTSLGVRQLAAYLMEFSIAGQRRKLLAGEKPAGARNNTAGIINPIQKKTRFYNKSPRKVLTVAFGQKRFESPSFRDYVERARAVDKEQADAVAVVAATSTSTTTAATATRYFEPPSLLTQKVSFVEDGLFSELYMAHVLWEWMYASNKGDCWLSTNPKRLLAATAWIRAHDVARRRVFFDLHDGVARQDALTVKIVAAVGQDYEMRLRKLRKRVEWICRSSRNAAYGRHAQTAMVSGAEADYLDELLRLEEIRPEKKK